MQKFLYAIGLVILLAGFVYHPSTIEVHERVQIYNLPSVGDQIKKGRIAARLSQKALADAVGLSLYNVQTIEKGKAVPTRDIMLKIQQLLKIEIVLDV